MSNELNRVAEELKKLEQLRKENLRLRQEYSLLMERLRSISEPKVYEVLEDGTKIGPMSLDYYQKEIAKKPLNVNGPDYHWTCCCCNHQF